MAFKTCTLNGVPVYKSVHKKHRGVECRALCVCHANSHRYGRFYCGWFEITLASAAEADAGTMLLLSHSYSAHN